MVGVQVREGGAERLEDGGGLHLAEGPELDQAIEESAAGDELQHEVHELRRLVEDLKELNAVLSRETSRAKLNVRAQRENKDTVTGAIMR